MALKRKRSDSEISTSSSLLSSPISSSNFMSIDSISSHQSSSTPSLFSSRTHKRHRDNRPAEADVHQHTLSLLYSAQQPSSQPQLHITPPHHTPVQAVHASSNQSSLHSFWTLPSKRHSSPSSNSSLSSYDSISPMTVPTVDSLFLPMNCEDCEARLNPVESDDAMDVDMNAFQSDTAEEINHACMACGKQVCHGCAVSNLGAERKCLMCAGKKKWVGGLGWMSTD